MVHCAGSILVVNLIIGKGSSAARTPVYKIMSFIDKSALIQSNKNLADSLRKTFIHSKALAFPVS